MHILAAEDDRLTRRVLQEIITSERRFELVMVEDGLEAWRQLCQKGRAFDLCIFDISMPGLDAFGLLSRIRADFELRQMPVVLFTASHDVASVRKAIGYAVTGFLVKPCDRTKILEKLYQIESAIMPPKQDSKAVAPLPGGDAHPPAGGRSEPGAPDPAEEATLMTDIGFMCAKLKLTPIAFGILVRILVRDVRRWLPEAVQVTDRQESLELCLRMRALIDSANDLGQLALRDRLNSIKTAWGAVPADGGGGCPVPQELEIVAALLDAVLEELGSPPEDTGPIDNPQVRPVRVTELKVGHILHFAVLSKAGLVLVTAGITVTESLIQHLSDFADAGDVREPIFVKDATLDAEAATG